VSPLVSARRRFATKLAAHDSSSSKSKWARRVDPVTKKEFEYDPRTFETRELVKYTRPEYATAWKDDRFPEVVQFTEFNSKRPYYWNRATNAVSWAPPSDPNLDVFAKELADRRILKAVENPMPASLPRRAAAALVDVGAAFAFGTVFGTGVFLDLGRLGDALPSVGLAAWVAFVARDSVFERGTRSLGKRLLKLEIVKWNGQLPSRYNTAARNFYLPVYALAPLAMPYFVLLPVVEMALLLFSPRSFRLGDLTGLTCVIKEAPDRAERLKEKMQRDDEDELKE